MPDPRDFLPASPFDGPPIPNIIGQEFTKAAYETSLRRELKHLTIDDIHRLLPEYTEVLSRSGGHKPVKFIESIVVIKCPAPFNPSAQGDFAYTQSFSYDGRTLSSGPAFSYDTMLATRVNPYERIVNVPPGIRVWITTYDGQWGGFWSRVDVYMNEADFSRMAAQVAEPLKPYVELTDRQKTILATIRAYTSSYRRDVFARNKVTLAEIDELYKKGFVDRRGALTRLGRIAAEDIEPWF
jgi:hypothetical protein